MRNMKSLMDLSDRTALITGGAGHIGMAMAEAVAEQGCRVVLLDLDQKKLDAAASYLAETYDIAAHGIAVDLEDESAIKQVPGLIESLTGSLDILINNAAFVGTNSLSGWCVPFAEQTASTWRRALEVNLTAVFELTQCCEQLLKCSSHASVINISSIYGVLGPDMSLYAGTSMGNPAAYAASKGGMLQLTRWLATVLSPTIRVNAISPGGVERGQLEVFQERYINKVPLRRMGKEEDLKGVTLFLASDMSAYVTGQNIMVDGGFSAW